MRMWAQLTGLRPFYQYLMFLSARRCTNLENKKKKKNSGIVFLIDNIRHHKLLYLMALPVIIYYLVFHFLPMFGLIISFQRYVPSKGYFGSEWVGLDNFTRFFKDIYFGRLLKNTFQINLLDLIIGFPAPIIFALMLNEIGSMKFKKITQTITYMPYFISLVVICGLISTFTKESGPISYVISAITGKEPQNLLASPGAFQPLYVITNIWQGFGWGSIIYFASLSNVDPELYEAAAIDGAGRFRRMLSVTLPAIAPTIVIMLILRIGNMMSLGYEKIILLYSPITYSTADVISSYVYRVGLVQMDYSYGSAVGLFNSLINLVLIVGANWVSQRVNETSLW